MTSQPLLDLSPLASLLLVGLLLALVAVAWVGLRHPPRGRRQWCYRLTALTLFLTFDLVVFGAFTRLTDSGLGCPDWPGCYGSASPLGAKAPISAAQAQLPSGPVTHTKAWIEMVHRYLATAVGALITGLALLAWPRRRTSTGAGPSSGRPAVNGQYRGSVSAPRINHGVAKNLDGYSPLHAARAELLRQLGHIDDAAAEFTRALAGRMDPAMHRFLERRRDE